MKTRFPKEVRDLHRDAEFYKVEADEKTIVLEKIDINDLKVKT